MTCVVRVLFGAALLTAFSCADHGDWERSRGSFCSSLNVAQRRFRHVAESDGHACEEERLRQMAEVYGECVLGLGTTFHVVQMGRARRTDASERAALVFDTEPLISRYRDYVSACIRGDEVAGGKALSNLGASFNAESSAAIAACKRTGRN